MPVVENFMAEYYFLAILIFFLVAYLGWISFRNAQIKKQGTACSAEICEVYAGRYSTVYVVFTYDGQ